MFECDWCNETYWDDGTTHISEESGIEYNVHDYCLEDFMKYYKWVSTCDLCDYFVEPGDEDTETLNHIECEKDYATR